MVKKIVTNLKELRKPSEIVTDFAETRAIIKDLEDSLDCKKGIGLSAIQIGITKQVGIIRFSDESIDLINPKIIEKHDKFRMEKEACLSLPGISVDTIRYKEITIENNGKIYSLDLQVDGIICIALQHEIEHIKGRTILDSKWRKR